MNPAPRAMILAAGRGIRLDPITRTLPKPLIPISGTPLIDGALCLLQRHGIRDVIINLHHLGEKIRAHVGNGARFDMRVVYSVEAQMLGTGGGLAQAAEFFSESRGGILLNADALMSADISTLWAQHQHEQADVTMTLLYRKDEEGFTPVDVDANGSIRGFGRGEYLYTGLMAFGPRLLATLPPAGTVSCLIQDGIIPLIAAGGSLRAFFHEGYWNDLGTKDRFAQAEEDIRNGLFVIPKCN